MRNLHTMLAAVAALTMGASLFGLDPAHAQLGNGSGAIGAGGEAIGTIEGGVSEGERAAAPRIVGGCVTNRTAYRTQSNTVTTTSSTFVTMPNTHLPVTHAAGCLIVDVVGEVTNTNTATMFIRAWIGGIGAAEPPDGALGVPALAGAIETRSMRFVFPNVPAGTHTVRIEWRTFSGTMFALHRALTVMHR